MKKTSWCQRSCILLLMTAMTATASSSLSLAQKQMWMFTNIMRMFPSRFQEKWNTVGFICEESQVTNLPMLSWCSKSAKASEFQANTLIDSECSVRHRTGDTRTCDKYCVNVHECMLQDRIHYFCKGCTDAVEMVLQARKISPIAALEWWTQDHDSCPIFFNKTVRYMSSAFAEATLGIIPSVYLQDYVVDCVEEEEKVVENNIMVVHVVWAPSITCFYSITMDPIMEGENINLQICSSEIPMNPLFHNEDRKERTWELCFSPYFWNRFCGNDAAWETALLIQNYSIVTTTTTTT